MLRILFFVASFTPFGFAFIAPPAHAQATRTWVSGVGDDANPCSRTAPCKTFAGAISKTVAGGEINCLDPGGFGALTVTKAITISCEVGGAGVLVAGTNGINVSAGATDVVYLRGLDIQGSGSGLDGIKFSTGAALHVEKCLIRGFLGSPGNGIHFAPSGTSRIFVRDTVISDNNKGATAAGILIAPSGTGAASGIIERVELLNNGNGLTADGTGTTGNQMNFALSNSVISANISNGVSVVSATGRAPTRVSIDHSLVATNNIGIASSGLGADVTIAYSNVSGNNTGITFNSQGELRSYQTNQLRGNTIANGSPSSVVPLE